MPTMKVILREYMLNYPGSFVGFVKEIAGIIQEIGTEWEVFGKKEYATAFKLSSKLMSEVADNLNFIKEVFDKEQNDVKKDI